MERLVRAGCSMGNIRAEEASGAKDDRGGLLELLDLVVEGDTLVVTAVVVTHTDFDGLAWMMDPEKPQYLDGIVVGAKCSSPPSIHPLSRIARSMTVMFASLVRVGGILLEQPALPLLASVAWGRTSFSSLPFSAWGGWS